MGGWGTNTPGRALYPSPQTRMPPVQSFINLIIYKASQVLKKQTKPLLTVPAFLLQVWPGCRGRGRRGRGAPCSVIAKPTTTAPGPPA